MEPTVKLIISAFILVTFSLAYLEGDFSWIGEREKLTLCVLSILGVLFWRTPKDTIEVSSGYKVLFMMVFLALVSAGLLFGDAYNQLGREHKAKERSIEKKELKLKVFEAIEKQGNP